jgi:hypothetical protein
MMMGRIRERLERRRQGKPIHVWQHEVQDDQVRTYAPLQTASLPAGCRDAHSKPGKLKRVRERPSDNHIVLHHHDCGTARRFHPRRLGLYQVVKRMFPRLSWPEFARSIGGDQAQR